MNYEHAAQLWPKIIKLIWPYVWTTIWLVEKNIFHNIVTLWNPIYINNSSRPHTDLLEWKLEKLLKQESRSHGTLHCSPPVLPKAESLDSISRCSVLFDGRGDSPPSIRRFSCPNIETDAARFSSGGGGRSQLAAGRCHGVWHKVCM